MAIDPKIALQAKIDAAAATTAARAATIAPLANSGYSNANVRESRVTTPYGSPALEVAAAQADATAGLAAMNDPAMNAAIEGGFTAAASPIGLAAGTINPVTGDYPADNPVDKPVDKPYKNVITGGITTETKDAFAAMKMILAQYHLESLSDTLTQLMEDGKGAEEALNIVKYDNRINPQTQMPWNAAYNKRFAGNVNLVKNGMNAMSEAAYINLEDSMAQTLQAYGHGAMHNTNRDANEATMAQWIGNNWNATDFDKLIKNVSTRVENADSMIMKEMQTYYPEISKTDLVSYFLDPKQGLTQMEKKISAGEVGAAFVNNNLSGFAGLTNVEDLVKAGVTGATVGAQAGNIIGTLAPAQKLGDIYAETGVTYGQQDVQDEFLKGNTGAQNKRKLLASAERAMFAGDSGISATTGYGINRSIQGKF